MTTQKEAVAQVQRHLSWLGLYRSKIDGKWGSHSAMALDEFMEKEGYEGDVYQKLADKVGGFSVDAWNDKYGLARAVYDLCHHMYRGRVEYPAYIMATIEHETNATFEPVQEAGYLPKAKRDAVRARMRYKPYWGRGYVQLTWDYNYEKYSEILGIDIVSLNRVHLACDPLISLFITVHGMITGTFTGRSLDQYFVNGLFDSLNARRTVNGIRRGDKYPDKAHKIQGHYFKWKEWYETNY